MEEEEGGKGEEVVVSKGWRRSCGCWEVERGEKVELGRGGERGRCGRGEGRPMVEEHDGRRAAQGKEEKVRVATMGGEGSSGVCVLDGKEKGAQEREVQGGKRKERERKRKEGKEKKRGGGKKRMEVGGPARKNRKEEEGGCKKAGGGKGKRQGKP